MLLSRAAEQIYWAARYLERAEDTARLVRVYTEMIIDLPVGVMSSWQPLATVADGGHGDDSVLSLDETAVVRRLLADPNRPGSVVFSITCARENLRTTREIIPREAWQAVNDLYLFARADPSGGVDRARRGRFCTRVVEAVQQLDGILTSTMSRDQAYELWRLGESIERADMTARILGVRAESLLHEQPVDAAVDGVQWLGVLRSLSALQMFQRSSAAPIDGPGVVAFLLGSTAFPRAVAYGVQRIAEACDRLPHQAVTGPALFDLRNAVTTATRDLASECTGLALGAAMDQLQQSLIDVDRAVAAAFFLTRSY